MRWAAIRISHVEQAYKLVLPEIIKATAEAKSRKRARGLGALCRRSTRANGRLQKVVIREGQLQLLSLDWI